MSSRLFFIVIPILSLLFFSCNSSQDAFEVTVETDLSPNEVLKHPFVYKLDGDRGYVIDTLQLDDNGNYSSEKKYGPGLYRAIINREYGIDFIDDSIEVVRLSLYNGKVSVEKGYPSKILYEMKDIIDEGKIQWENYMKEAEAKADVDPDLLDSIKAQNRRKLVAHIRQNPEQISSLTAFSYINIVEHKPLFDSVIGLNKASYGDIKLIDFYINNYKRLSDKDLISDN